MSPPLPQTMLTLLQPTSSSHTLTLTSVPLPTPTPNTNEHLIRVHAVALTNNELTWLHNFPPPPSSLPKKEPVPFYDMSGVIVTAPENSPFPVGTEVFARTDYRRTGAGREYTICGEEELARKPGSLGFVEAATVPMSVETAWQALFTHGGLKPAQGGAKGKKVFITAGSGAVGMWMIQLAKWAGAEVSATASGDRLDFVHSLGASEVLDYRTSDIKKWIDEDGARKADLVIDCTGRKALADAWLVVKDGGTLISIFQPPEGMKPAEFDRKDIRNLFFVQEPIGEQAGEVAKLIDGGGFVTAVDSVWPVEKFAEAVQRMESGKARGKVVIQFVANV